MTAYKGPLTVQAGQSEGVYEGCLLIDRDDNGRVYAHFVGSFQELSGLHLSDGEDFSKVSLPGDLDLEVPPQQSLRDLEPAPGSSTIPVEIASGGALGEADHLLIGVATDATPRLSMAETSAGLQSQQKFELPGWELTLALVRSEGSQEWVIQACPTDVDQMAVSNVRRLALRLFNLFSFLVSREVGIGPTVGISSRGRIVWAEFSSCRKRPGRSGFRWCDEAHFGPALETTAIGYSHIIKDRAMEEILGRSIEALSFANSGEVVDVRIPVVCTALETLSWTYLRRWAKIGRNGVDRMNLAEMLRRILSDATIPTGIPEHLASLRGRAESVENLEVDDAPGVLASVRNGLVHPPTDLKDPEWPSAEQQIEAWQISTWYLELILLLWLQYDGEYLPRIQLWNGSIQPVPVPWAVPTKTAAQ